jgi:UDP-glucose 4-epimerase
MSQTILITGGAGYIGSHTAVALLAQGYDVVVVDSLVNSSPQAIQRIENIAGRNVTFYNADVRDQAVLAKIFTTHLIDGVVHFAGLKAVGESVEKPLLYYQANIDCTLSLLETMETHEVRTLVFSSSATVYGNPTTLPISESAPFAPTNPYGQTKAMIEQILQDLVRTNHGWNITSLRYFNPIGAHHSGQIGEDPRDIPNNLLPYIAQVAIGRRKTLSVFGNDYDTPDGTGVRDYIHVVDLALAHIAALTARSHAETYKAYNVGTGRGTSVLEMIRAFETACEQTIPYSVVARRAGDIATCYADVSRILTELGWTASRSVEQACADTWRWQSKNPHGYLV